jgi:hypothetical protein
VHLAPLGSPHEGGKRPSQTAGVHGPGIPDTVRRLAFTLSPRTKPAARSARMAALFAPLTVESRNRSGLASDGRAAAPRRKAQRVLASPGVSQLDQSLRYTSRQVNCIRSPEQGLLAPPGNFSSVGTNHMVNRYIASSAAPVRCALFSAIPQAYLPAARAAFAGDLAR